MTSSVLALLFVLLFLLLLVLGMPIASVMALVGDLGYGAIGSFKSAIKLVSLDMFTSFTSYDMSTVVMFVWMGYIAYRSGVGGKLFEFAYRCLGHQPGGLCVAAEVACAAFGAVCGSAPATVATIGSIACPEMKKHGYDDTLRTACVAAGGGLGILIPPSTMAIIYGISTGCSISKLFIAGIGGGILLMLMYIVVVWIQVAKNPSMAPKGERFTFKEKIESLNGGLFETLVIFILSIGGLSIGWFTPTEGGAIGCFLMLVLTVVRRKLSWKDFIQSLVDTAETVGMILFCLACASLFGRFIAIAQIPTAVSGLLMSINSKYVVYAIILVIYLIAGCFIDGITMVTLTVPIFAPIIEALGFDLIWFGVVIVMCVCMGQITPPVGMGAYVAHGVAPDVPLQQIFSGIWPFLLAILVSIVLITIFPQIVLFIPNMMVV